MAGAGEDRAVAGTLTLPSAVFAPVRSYPAFEETVERLGTAIKLGLLAPASRLPAERELCARLGIARSTLRQALIALTQSGHVFATRGRGGGTFVADPLPPADPASRSSPRNGRTARNLMRSTTSRLRLSGRSMISGRTVRRTSGCTSAWPRR